MRVLYDLVGGIMPYKDPEKRKEYKRKYDLANKEKIAKRNKESRLNNKEKFAERKRKWRLNNKEKIKEYELKNKEKIAKRQKEWAINNKEQLILYRMNEKNNLSDTYVKRLITARSPLRFRDIPQDLVALKRTEIQMKKHIQELKQCEQ